MAYVDLRNAAIAKSVQSVRCPNPDVALSIFKNRFDLTVGETICNQKLILLQGGVGKFRQY
jgi:hypothetical protein